MDLTLFGKFLARSLFYLGLKPKVCHVTNFSQSDQDRVPVGALEPQVKFPFLKIQLI